MSDRNLRSFRDAIIQSDDSWEVITGRYNRTAQCLFIQMCTSHKDKRLCHFFKTKRLYVLTECKDRVDTWRVYATGRFCVDTGKTSDTWKRLKREVSHLIRYNSYSSQLCGQNITHWLCHNSVSSKGPYYPYAIKWLGLFSILWFARYHPLSQCVPCCNLCYEVVYKGGLAMGNRHLSVRLVS